MRHSTAWPRIWMLRCAKGSFSLTGHADLHLHDVDAGDQLGHRVLHLHARVFISMK